MLCGLVVRFGGVAVMVRALFVCCWVCHAVSQPAAMCCNVEPEPVVGDAISLPGAGLPTVTATGSSSSLESFIIDETDPSVRVRLPAAQGLALGFIQMPRRAQPHAIRLEHRQHAAARVAQPPNRDGNT